MTITLQHLDLGTVAGWVTGNEGFDQCRRYHPILFTHQMDLLNARQTRAKRGRVQRVMQWRNSVVVSPGRMVKISCDRYHPRHILTPRGKQQCQGSAAGITDQHQTLCGGPCFQLVCSQVKAVYHLFGEASVSPITFLAGRSFCLQILTGSPQVGGIAAWLCQCQA